MSNQLISKTKLGEIKGLRRLDVIGGCYCEIDGKG